MGNKSYRSVVCVVLAVFLFAGMVGCKKKEEVQKETPLTVTVSEAAVRDIAETAVYSGFVKGKSEVSVYPKIPGRVIDVLVKEGDYVRENQPIIILDSSDYEVSLKQAEAAKAQAEVQLKTAESNLERTRKLYEAGAASAQQLESAETAAESARIAVEQAQAGIEAALLQIENCTIKAPINGVVGSVGITEGTMVSSQMPVAVIFDPADLEVEVMAGEADINYISSGGEVDVYVKAAREEVYKGVVTSVARVADATRKGYPVKIKIVDKDDKLKSGMFAEVKLAARSKGDVLSVPRNAVVPKGAKTVVYVIDKENRARMREVKTGIEGGRYIEIKEGLKAGEKVIVKGNTLVDDGTLVKVAGGDK
ncbi:efflux RND transporter periplasmic adaptor subunit [Thermosyntropha sp.]|uniref:efflux RND transporter periplasmic adaptor subunit n=1 Tax=Thermosyntropha sp. TaxID=2740820 RepID=UPI0025D069EF|nr:efflux RND transporter periplasmic adaptor subunit [Thermosyntropha sp.]MBO8159061.1 efflux RND transporter periplasmic adaptor subunit [Thermosyntropha sp.]